MASYTSLCLFLVFTAISCSSDAYRFIVGGKDGWVLNPSENYNHWTERMRFQVNDTLFFKYKKGTDSVLVVSKDDYDKCNTEKPIMKMEDGDSVFKFDRSGPFFFISGKNGTCEKGQKLIIVVLAVRNQHKSPPPVGQTPTAAPPTGSPFPAPAMTPAASPSPVAKTPSLSPAPAMSPTSPPSPVPSPSAMTPVVTPAPAITPVSPSPSNTPAVSPAPASLSTSPSPTASSPSTSPSPSTVNPPTSGNTPADVNAPAQAPTRSSAPVFTPPVVLVSIVLSVALAGFITAP
uniref:Phytocyanin domain-containing protein n=1 Tax=Davidia involucrata TaxID=16924 RepID=A0A5B7AWV4_DAVIN